MRKLSKTWQVFLGLALIVTDDCPVQRTKQKVYILFRVQINAMIPIAALSETQRKLRFFKKQRATFLETC